MKSFLRALCATMLCVCLLTFALWRYEALPDLSGITSWLQNVKDKATDLIEGVTDGQNGSAPERPVESGNEYTGYTPTEELPTDLLTVICEAYDNHVTEVDLSAFELTADELKTVISGVRYSCPEYFYVDNGYSYSSDTTTQLVTLYCPAYLVDQQTAAQQTEGYNAFVNGIAAGVPADSTDFEKVLYVHDYFVRNFEYDYDYEIRDAYTFFETGEGVCQAYMLAFIAVANELGIRSVPVTSNAMNHAWNMVEIDGEWYHLDITWDDSGSYPSFTSYAYFLQSDSGIYNYDTARTDDPQRIHHEWVCSEQATDERYDGVIWREARSPMAVVNGGYYCVISKDEQAGGYLYGGDDPLQMERLIGLDGTWRHQGTSSYYPGCYSGLIQNGNEVIYNTDKTIRAYNVVTKKDRLVGIPSLDRSASIYGFTQIDPITGELTYLVAGTPSGEYAMLVYMLPK